MSIEAEIQTVSSLQKIFPCGEIELPQASGSMLKDERFAFQVAIRAKERILGATLEIVGDGAAGCRVRRVDLAPAYQTELEKTEYVIEQFATLYPEILVDDDCRDISLRADMWTVFWITAEGLSVGEHEFEFYLSAEGERLAETRYRLEVIGENLSSEKIMYSNWMHYDCIANYYGLKVFSERYYKILGKFMDNAVAHGVNLLYTPLFTPPLDTQVGGERTTVQLVDVERQEKSYSFGFDRLKAFLRFAENHGFEYFEFSHLFSQWGALSAPKIIDVQGNRLFGWETASDGEEYLNFLDGFLQKFNSFIADNGLKGRCFFHLSDEPGINCIERYRKLSAFVKERMTHATLMDALSNYDFYERKLVDLAVVATSSVNDFLGKAKNYWIYYCCGQYKNGLSNRFFNIPPERNRILGTQLYLNDIGGFLHWGYNFYNSYLSKHAINPYLVTDGDGAFQAGDCFVVYPGKNCVLDSVRHEVFYEGLQDYRALKRLELKKGRKFTETLLKSFGIGKDFETYPHDARELIRLRETINMLIKNS